MPITEVKLVDEAEKIPFESKRLPDEVIVKKGKVVLCEVRVIDVANNVLLYSFLDGTTYIIGVDVLQ